MPSNSPRGVVVNNRAIRFTAIIFLFAGLQPAMAQDADTPAQLAVIDLRPEEEKEGSALSPLRGKCNQDVFRVADVASDPLKVDVLEEDLARLEGMNGTLTVLNWSIYYNKQVQKSGSLFESVGIQGYAIPGKKKERHAGSKCSRQESAGGWYQGSELTSVYFPLISEFEGTFRGKPISVRVVYSPRTKLPGTFSGEYADTEALLEAVHQTAEAVSAAALR
jgi:hypothetical protein